MANHNKITQKDIEFIKNNLKPANELAKILKRHPTTIRNIAKEIGIKLPRPKAWRKHTLNEKYFETWTKEMAYILGFVMADGCVALTKRNGGMVCVGLQERDIEILERIKKAVGFNGDIFKYKINNKNYIRLSLCSRYMVNSLIKIGCGPNKTLRLSFPEIPEEFLVDFIRGYFDGDGHLSIIKTANSNTPNLKFGFTGQGDFLIKIKEVFNHQLANDFGCLVKQKIQNCSQLSFSGVKLALIFGKWLYGNSTENTRLIRKFNKYKKYELEFNYKLTQKRSKHPIQRISRSHCKLSWDKVKEIRIEHSNGTSTADLARKYKVDFRTIKQLLLNKTWKSENSAFYESIANQV